MKIQEKTHFLQIFPTSLKFHTDPLSSRHQFYTNAIYFQPPTPLSSIPKTSQFNTPSSSTPKTRLFNTPLCSIQSSVQHMFLMLNEKYLSVPHRPAQFNTSVPHKDHTFLALKIPQFHTKNPSVKHTIELIKFSANLCSILCLRDKKLLSSLIKSFFAWN